VTFLITVAEISEGFVNLSKKFGQHIVAAGFQSGGRLLERAGEHLRDFFDGNPAREFASARSAHSVADGKSEVGGRDGGFAKFSQVMNFPRIELKAQKRIFVIGAHLAAV
jgi:hypothetical protein